jgi:hypothetical protein
MIRSLLKDDSMNFPFSSRLAFRMACVAAAVSVGNSAFADSFTSSASSAGSASSGSVSDSLHGSSKSSTGNDKTAEVDYRIIDVAPIPGRAGIARVTMRASDPDDEIALDLPQVIVEKQRLALGDSVHSSKQVYGYEFARSDTRQAFFLVLADDWANDLAARPVSF